MFHAHAHNNFFNYLRGGGAPGASCWDLLLNVYACLQWRLDVGKHRNVFFSSHVLWTKRLLNMFCAHAHDNSLFLQQKTNAFSQQMTKKDAETII